VSGPRPDPWAWLTENRVTFALKLLLVIVLGLYLAGMLLSFLDRVHTIVYILVGAIFFAYLIFPAVRFLERRMPRIVAILAVYLAIAVVLVLAGWLIVPRIADDISQLVAQYPHAMAQTSSFVNDPQNPIAARLPEWMRAELAHVPDQVIAWSKLHGLETAGQAITILLGTVAALATFVIIPLFTAYLLLDMDNIKHGFFSLIPEERLKPALRLLDEIDDVIGGFIRGQLLVALSVGVLITIALAIMGVKYAFLLGLLAAVGDLIPYVGAVLAFTPSFLIALVNNGWANAVVVGVVFLVIFEVEGHLIAPNIVSRQVRLSPLIVLIALLVGGEMAGIVGMLIAVPIAGTLRVVVNHMFGRPEAHRRPKENPKAS